MSDCSNHDPRWVDAHYYGFHGQTNVYTLAKALGSEGNHKFLVASIRGEVIVMKYHRIFDKLTPCARGVHFTYIPADAEIVSLDTFTKRRPNSGLVVGITFIKNEESENKSTNQFLNIYSSWQKDEEFNLDSIAQSCYSVELHYTPYQLMHTELIISGLQETVFLLSGNDLKVHLYREDSDQHTFSEDTHTGFFPELTNIVSNVLWMDIVYDEERGQRITAIGHHSGQVTAAVVNYKTAEILQIWSLHLDGPITTVKIFSQTANIKPPAIISHISTDDETCTKQPDYHLLVTSAVEGAVVYWDILKHGLDKALILPGSVDYDSVMCACVLDVDFDGCHELLLGTYGQELLVYKYCEETSVSRSTSSTPASSPSSRQTSPETPNNKTPPGKNKLQQFQPDKLPDQSLSRKSSDHTHHPRGGHLHAPTLRAKSQEDLFSKSPTTADTCDTEKLNQCTCHCRSPGLTSEGSGSSKDDIKSGPHYKLLWKRSFAHPILAIDFADIMGDGLNDLAVVTLKGLHILQPDLEEVARLCIARMENITKAAQRTTIKTDEAPIT